MHCTFTRRVLVWFARNHDEHLTTQDLSARFDVPIRDVVSKLRGMRGSGLLCVEGRGVRGDPYRWYAGRVLLHEIGELRDDSPASTEPETI